MPIDVPTDEWKEIVSDVENSWYTLQVKGDDLDLSLDGKPESNTAGVEARDGDTMPVDASSANGVYAKAKNTGATVRPAKGRAERQARREIERPSDKATRTGELKTVTADVTALATSTGQTPLFLDNETTETRVMEGLHIGIDGNYTDTLYFNVQVLDENSNVVVEYPGNIEQYPQSFEPAYPVPGDYTVELEYVNETSSDVDFKAGLTYR